MRIQFSTLNRFATMVLSKAEDKLKLRKGTAGKDLIEYALMSAFVAAVAGAIMRGSHYLI